MKRKVILIAMLFGLLGSFCLISPISASPFIPLEWQTRVKSGPLEDQRKHVNWSRDQNGDFIDDAFQTLNYEEKTDVILQLSDCAAKEELTRRFSQYGDIKIIGELVAYVYLANVEAKNLEALAKDSYVAAVEKPVELMTDLDTSTRSVRARASNTYSPESFAEAFGYDGTGINIAVMDTGVDDTHIGLAGKYVAGYNGVTDTVGNPVDDNRYVGSGADGICDTTAIMDDVQVVPVGQGAPDTVCVWDGGDGFTTVPAGDDTIYFNVILTGADGICDTAAAAGDVQIIAVGRGQANRGCISFGPNRTVDTAPVFDDSVRGARHGSHVAGIAMGLGTGTGCGPADDGSTPNNCEGMAPGAGLIDVKVLGFEGSGSEQSILRGIEWVWSDGRANVLNLSIGTASEDDGTSTISKALNALVANDISVATSSGNTGDQRIDHTGAAELVVTVGSSDDSGSVDRDDDTMSFFSTFGPRVDMDVTDPTLGMFKPDLVAPGSSIGSVDGNSGNGYHTISGTSMSSPHVAGAMALLLDMRSDLPPGALKDLLLRSAYETPAHATAGASFPALDAVWNDHWGKGLLDVFEAGSLLADGITDLSFTDCTGPHPDYPDNRRWLLSGGKPSYANNVDITLATDPPIQEVPNTINIRVENRGTSTAERIVVSVGVKDFAVGVLEFYDVGSREVASLGPGASTIVSFPWTPSASNHQCIQATIDYGFDTDFANNMTQRNVAPITGASPSKATFRVENPLQEEADIILQVKLDERAKKILEVVNIEGIPIGKPFTMQPGDCPVIGEIEFIPNGDLPVGTEGMVDVAARAYSEHHQEGLELSGVVFHYQTVAAGLQYAYTCADHRDSGELCIPLALAGRPTSDPRRLVEKVKAVFNVSVQPNPKLTLEESIKISAHDGSKVPPFQAFFDNGENSGNELILLFEDPLPDEERYTFDFSRLEDLDGDPLTGDPDFDLRVVQADANNSGSVTGADVSYVRGRINQPVEYGPTSRSDGNMTGTLTGSDISYIRGRIGHSAP